MRSRGFEALAPSCWNFGGAFTAVLAVIAAMMALAAPAGAQRVPVVGDHETESVLIQYANPLLRAANLGSEQVAMRIVPDRSFNAFVLDGQNVYIHIGTILQSKLPNEVIGVIAHEIGHIDGAHIAALTSRLQRETTKLVLLRVLGIGAAILGGGPGAIMAADEIIVRGFLAERRQQEAAADQAGLRYLENTGQSGRGMLTTFATLREENRINSAINPYLLSHPTETARIAQLDQRVRASRFFGASDPPERIRRHQLMRAKLYGYCDQSAGRSAFKAGSLPALYVQAIAANCSGDCSGVCTKANPTSIALIDRLIETGRKQDATYPYFIELKGQVLRKSGRAGEAIPHLSKALQLVRSNRSRYPGPDTLIEKELARSMIESGDQKHLKGAVSMLERIADLGEGDASTYDSLAKAYGRRGLIGMADLSTARAHEYRGNFRSAVIFAKRAQRALKPGSRGWTKAEDIVRLAPKPRNSLFGP
ncbi:MAG: hypothetical protein RLZ98_1386 [Pseudomonadota bacterium]|jgi:predicted Zn-dependent protease